MLASVSGNETIKILKRVNKKWIEIQEMKYTESSNGHRHGAAIIDICWAHPLFGSVFATLSIDKMINIFQLKLTRYDDNDEQSFSFVQIAYFTESANIVCCQFTPHHLGLKLAIVCSDGIVKMMEARDITNLSQWMLSKQIVIDENKLKPFHMLPFKPNFTQNKNIHRNNNKKDIKIFCISWNHSPFEFPSFCVGANKNRIYIYGYYYKTWNCIQKINIDATQHSFDVFSICWSNSIARKYHSIALGCSDGFVRVIKITANRKKDNKAFVWNCVFASKIHSASVCKIKWNSCGTSLISVDRAGNVYLLTKERNKDNYVANCLIQKEVNVKDGDMNKNNNDKVFSAFRSNIGSTFASNAPSNGNDKDMNKNNNNEVFSAFGSNINDNNNNNNKFGSNFGSNFAAFGSNNNDGNNNNNNGDTNNNNNNNNNKFGSNFGSNFAAFGSNNNDGNNNFGANFGSNAPSNDKDNDRDNNKSKDDNKENGQFNFGSFGNTNNNGFSFGDNAFSNPSNKEWTWGDNK